MRIYRQIDRSIEQQIMALREMGYVTMYSCSGILADHEDIMLGGGGLAYPYISFNLERQTLQKSEEVRAAAIAAGFVVQYWTADNRDCNNAVTRTISVYGMSQKTDAERLLAWDRFFRYLGVSR